MEFGIDPSGGRPQVAISWSRPNRSLATALEALARRRWHDREAEGQEERSALPGDMDVLGAEHSGENVCPECAGTGRLKGKSAR